MKIKEIEYGETMTHEFENCKVLFRVTLEDGEQEKEVLQALKFRIREQQQIWLSVKSCYKQEYIAKVEQEIEEKEKELESLREKIGKAYKLLGDSK